ncbi:MAG: Bax inhibitor-1/YccA family protein [Bullifex sp.]|nr:Bax inhibitor-1/YccA family protein [Spirochaetales bacterium]MDY3850341.1 Bax inhibitor-1/YccA family protein [Bullifex sp.]MDY4797789.1 Bax inhibitor-1/YccA family protein [Bullifex sp.]MDY5055794.1 Bax inhibitor-1/YccA family protein [Bullifex sp.]
MAETNLSVLQNTQARANGLLKHVYGYMFVGLLLTSVFSFLVSQSSRAVAFIYSNPFVTIILCVAELALVFYLSARIERISMRSAQLCFFAYSILTGVTLSSVFLVYTGASIAKAFVTTCLMFGGLTVYAGVTKRNIASWGTYLMMGLWGIIIAGAINMFFGFRSVDLLISVLGVIVFLGLTVYDTKRVLDMNREYGSEMTEDEYVKLGVIGALNLYLDFLNIFLYLLRLFSSSSRDK